MHKRTIEEITFPIMDEMTYEHILMAHLAGKLPKKVRVVDVAHDRVSYRLSDTETYVLKQFEFGTEDHRVRVNYTYIRCKKMLIIGRELLGKEFRLWNPNRD